MAGQTKRLEMSGPVDEVLFRPISNQVFGVGAVLLGAVLSLGFALSKVGAAWPAVWRITVMGVLLGIAGWHDGFRSWLEVTATGPRVDAVIARFNQFNYVGALLGSVLTGVVGSGTLRVGFAVPMVLILGMVPLARAFAPSLSGLRTASSKTP